MIIAEQIANYLSSQGLGTYDPAGIEGNIYIDMLPSGPLLIAIYNRGGSGNDVKNQYNQVGIQVIYRGDKNPIASFDKATQIFSKLVTFTGLFTAGGNPIISCLSPMGHPECIGRSANEEYEYTMNFTIEYVY